jgi:hypothetical protein
MVFFRAAALLVFASPLSLATLATAQPTSTAPGPGPASASTTAPTPAAAPAAAPESAPAPALASYSDLLKPSLSKLYGTLADLKLDKWKNGNVRAEAEHDTASIVDDLNQKVPDLMKDADAAPRRVGAALPLARNFAALYDVSLRVLDAARIAAPADQAVKIQEALNSLSAANRALYDRLEQAATAQESHIGDLETKIKAQQEAAMHPVQMTTPPPACPTPVKKAAVKRKPAAKPASTTTQGSGSSGGSTQQKPQQN